MSRQTAAHQSPDKLSIVRLACTLATFMAISFVLCVVFGYIFPGLRGLMPVTFFPGFSWEQPFDSVARGLVEHRIWCVRGGPVRCPLQCLWRRWSSEVRLTFL